MHPTIVTSLAALERRNTIREQAERRSAAIAAQTAAGRAVAHETERTRVRASLLLVEGRDKPTRGRWA